MSDVPRPFDIPSTHRPCPTLPVGTSHRISLPRQYKHRSRKGRAARWIPQAFTEADFNRGMQILEEWGPKHTNSDRVISSFETSCYLSGMNMRDPRAAVSVLGQMANSGLGAGTTDTYIGYLHKKYKMPDVMKAASARHADAEVRHAPDISDEILWKYVEEADFIWQPIFYVLFVAGLRPIALRFLRRNRLFVPGKRRWGKDNIEVTVKIDKTRKKSALRAILSLPASWEWIPEPPTDEVWNFLSQGDDPEERIFQGVTATHINTELRKM